MCSQVLTGVHFLLMLMQVVFNLKSSATVRAHVRPCLRVDNHVFGKCAAVAKTFPAHWALEGSLAGVDVAVLL